MGCFNWFFKILGIIFMIIVAVLLPITIVANEVSDLLFSTENVFSMIDEELINSEFMEVIIGEVLVELQTEDEGTDETIKRTSTMTMVEAIPAETMNEALRVLIPIEMISDLFGEIADGFYIWLNSEGYQTGISIDFRPLKINVVENISVAMAMVFEEMPECSAVDLVSWDFTCKPPDGLDLKALQMIDEKIAILLEDIPDQINIDEYLAGRGNEIVVLRNTLILVRDVLNYVWVLAAGIFLVGIILGARTIRGFFSWVGWPLLITSMIILMIGILFNISSEGIINFGITRIGLSIPTFLTVASKSILTSIFGLIGTAMIWKGLIVFAVGFTAIIISVLITEYRNRKSQIINNGSGEELISDLKPIENIKDHEDLD